MKNLAKLKTWAIIASFAAFSGCAHKQIQHSKPLPVGQVSAEQDKATVRVQQLGHEKNVLTSKKLIKRYVPLSVTITNHADEALYLDKHFFELPVATLEQVKNHYRPSYFGSRFKAGLLADLIVLPVFFILAANYGAVVELLLFQGKAVAYAVPFKAKATMFATKLAAFAALLYSGGKMHDGSVKRTAIRHAIIHEHCTDLIESLEVRPQTTVEKILYVPRKAFKSSFVLTLVNAAQAKQASFDVTL